MSWNDIINQNKAKEIILGQLKNNKIPHAYLFLGADGVGRKKFALEFAKVLNCSIEGNTDYNPCGHCIPCRKIEKGIHPDVQIIDFEWQAKLENKPVESQNSLKIKTIREMQKEVYFKPSESKWKIFIIEPAEKITIDAANSLLKTLEEPPSWTILILLAKHKENLPATVVSRTQIIPFCPLRESDIKDYLTMNLSLDEHKAREIAKFSEGSLGRALSIVGTDLNPADSFWKRISATRIPGAELLSLSQENSKTASGFLSELLMEVKRDFREDPEKYSNILNEILYSEKLLSKNANGHIVLDALFIKINNYLHK